MTVLVANVGERDLYYNIGDVSNPNFCHFELGKDDEKQVANHLECRNGARYISEEILKRLRADPSEAQRLRYPILKTVLDDGVLVSGKTIDKFLLVVTDQPEGTPEQHRCRDSLFTGQVLKELILQDYLGKIRAAEVVSYQENPANRERAYGFFGTLLLRLAPDSQVQEFHASLSGGAPALNDGLQEQALRLYKAKCHFYEVNPPSEQESRAGAEKGTLQPVSAKPFLRDLAISIIEQLLNRYDYSGALEVLKMFKAIKFWGDKVEAALRHADYRLNLNFNEAAGVLKQYKNSQPFQAWWQTANQSQELDRIIEAYFIAESRYRNREYADMLWRIRAIFEIAHGLLARKTAGRNPSEQEQAVTRLVYSLLGLKNLSNAMLHDLEGVSIGKINQEFTPPDTIRAKYGCKANYEFIIPTLRELITLLSAIEGRSATLQNPYQVINQYILKELGR